MVTRSLLVVGFVTASLLASTDAAIAKRGSGPWTCELPTTSPVIGEAVRLVVRFWEDAAHSEPSNDQRVRRLPYFIEARANIPGGRGHSRLWASLRRVRRGVFEGTIRFPDARRWEIHPCGAAFDGHG